MNAQDYLLSLWKTFVTTAIGLVVAWLVNHGIHLGSGLAPAVTVALVALGLSLYNTVVNWLLARDPSGAARPLYWLGKLLSLGGRAPTYTPTAAKPAGR